MNRLLRLSAIFSALPVFALLIAAVLPSPAAAQYLAERRMPARANEVGSPAWVAVELRGGPYGPDERFPVVFPDDSGPLLAAEVDFLFLRIPQIARVGVGTGFGWARYSGNACLSGADGTIDCTERSDEKQSLNVYPIPVLAVARIEALPRLIGIPLWLTGKIGIDVVPWNQSTGNEDSGSGFGFGFHWAAQVALELDFFEPRAARALDEEWGINHTFLFGELYGSGAKDEGGMGAIGLGDELSWAVGLGFIL